MFVGKTIPVLNYYIHSHTKNLPVSAVSSKLAIERYRSSFLARLDLPYFPTFFDDLASGRHGHLVSITGTQQNSVDHGWKPEWQRCRFFLHHTVSHIDEFWYYTREITISQWIQKGTILGWYDDSNLKIPVEWFLWLGIHHPSTGLESIACQERGLMGTIDKSPVQAWTYFIALASSPIQ